MVRTSCERVRLSTVPLRFARVKLGLRPLQLDAQLRGATEKALEVCFGTYEFATITGDLTGCLLYEESGHRTRELNMHVAILETYYYVFVDDISCIQAALTKKTDFVHDVVFQGLNLIAVGEVEELGVPAQALVLRDVDRTVTEPEDKLLEDIRCVVIEYELF